MDNKLTEVFTELPFSLLVSGNIIAKMKNTILEAGIDSIPCLTIVGKPGRGKTALAKAMVSDKEHHLYFTDGKAEITQSLLENAYSLVLLDDFPNCKSNSLREKYMNILEENTRRSHRGQGAVLALTIESEAFSKLSDSCKQRMMVYFGENILQDERKRNILCYLQEKPDEIKIVFLEFDKWYAERNSKYNFRQRLNQFRKEHSDMDFRSQTLFFHYNNAMKISLDFLKERYGIDTTNTFIDDNIRVLWGMRQIGSVGEDEIVKMIFERMIHDSVLKIYEPQAWNLCEHYCRNNCPCDEGRCQGMDSECYYLREGHYYIPDELVMMDYMHSGLLIRFPEKICGLPKYSCKKPFLIVESETLTAIFNSLLDQVCTENSVHLPYFTSKHLRKRLFDANLCFYRMIASGHNLHMFKYESVDNSDISVVLLRLSDAQAEMLAKNAMIKNYPWKANVSFYRKLQEMLGSMHTLAGEKG